MEHRLTRRLEVSLDLELSGIDWGPVAARTLNISRHGMFLETDSPGVLGRRLLDVRLRMGADDSSMRVYVIYRHGRGAGVWLVDSALDLERIGHGHLQHLPQCRSEARSAVA
jgi:hypothetical protein